MSNTINRGLILIIPKQPYYDWANSFDDEIVLSTEDTVEHNSYLIYDEWETGDKKIVIKPYFEDIFEEELFGIHTDPAGWPKDRSLETFFKWFDIHLSSMVYDMVDDEPIVSDDELDNIDFDALEFLSDLLDDNNIEDNGDEDDE